MKRQVLSTIKYFESLFSNLTKNGIYNFERSHKVYMMNNITKIKWNVKHTNQTLYNGHSHVTFASILKNSKPI